MSLHNLAAIVTGASGGIGSAVVAALAQRGVRVTATGRSQEKLNRLTKLRTIDPAKIITLPADLNTPSGLRLVFEQSHSTWGTLDILVNCAGIGYASIIRDAEPTHWKEMCLTNIVAMSTAIQQALQQFPASGGHIVNIGSTSSYRVSSIQTGFYAATKFAVKGLTEALRKELRARGSATRVTLVSPGRVRTSMFADSRTTQTSPSPTLRAAHVAHAVLWALRAPRSVEINEIVLRPRDQPD